jgi:hypothetical protein
MPAQPRPSGGVGGMKLHIFPPDTSAQRRRIRLLTAVLLAVTAWGIVSIRRHDITLADYRATTAELVEEMPYLVAASPAVVAAVLRAAVPRKPSSAWLTGLSDRVRSLLPR